MDGNEELITIRSGHGPGARERLCQQIAAHCLTLPNEPFLIVARSPEALEAIRARVQEILDRTPSGEGVRVVTSGPDALSVKFA